MAETFDQAVASGPLGPAFDIAYAVNSNSTLLAQARADGPPERRPDALPRAYYK